MKFRKKPPAIELSGIKATSTRAMFAGHETFPYIQFTFLTHDGEEYRVTLPLAEASKFTQQAINAIQAATPRVPRPSSNQLFD